MSAERRRLWNERIAPAIEWCAPGSLPREAHKTKYIEMASGES